MYVCMNVLFSPVKPNSEIYSVRTKNYSTMNI